ncbi:MAG: LytR/AlgR family response regulator transcription factor, partial [Muribaculaceae bacterium]
MNCIAIDDEPIALAIISKFCEHHGDITLVTFTSPILAMEHINRQMPDIVFLDVELNGTLGLDLARKLPSTCGLIFTTAYAQYAIDGFELNAIDFLHK